MGKPVKDSRLLERDALCLFDFFGEIPAFGIAHYDIDAGLLFRKETGGKVDDVGVVQRPHYFGLFDDVFSVCLFHAHYLYLFQDAELLIDDVSSQVTFSEGSMAQDLDFLEVFDGGLRI